jgi:hypothetical protein
MFVAPASWLVERKSHTQEFRDAALVGERSAQSGLPALLLAVWILDIVYRVLDACPMKHLFDVTCTAPAVLINSIDSIRGAGDHFALACPVSYTLRRRSYGDSFFLYLQLFLLPAGAGRR